MSLFSNQAPRGPETVSRTVNVPAFLADTQVHMRGSRPQPHLHQLAAAELRAIEEAIDDTKGISRDLRRRNMTVSDVIRRNGDMGRRDPDTVGETGALTEAAAMGYFSGWKTVAPVSGQVLEVFSNARYDDLKHGSDVTACFADSDGVVHAAAVDIFASTERIPTKLRSIFLGDGTGVESTRRLLPSAEHRGIFIPEYLSPEGEDRLDFLSTWRDRQGNPLVHPLPLTGYIDGQLFFSRLDIPKQVLEGSRDLFGLQLLVQARVIQGIIGRWIDSGVRGLGDGFTSAALLGRLQGTRDSIITARGFFAQEIPVIRATGQAAYAVTQALFASLYQRYPALKAFLEALDRSPSDVFTDSQAIRSAIQTIGPHPMLEATRAGTEMLISQLPPFVLASIDRPPVAGGNTFRDTSFASARPRAHSGQ